MRTLVALSGGVDSAVAALRLVRAGRDVQALFMSNWDENDPYCTVARDFQDARAVASELRIPLHRVSFALEYRARVFAGFLEELAAGRTPNPDVLCNREIKFGLCLAYARRLGGSRLATGHYARLEDGAQGPELHRARDEAKDQTYFLHAVDPEQLRLVEFPLGDLEKDEVRRLAREAGLPVHDKPDSTGICFIGERPFREFLAAWVPPSPGPIETADGVRVGTHQGLAFYTLGQRSGLEVGGVHGHAEAPWYVARKDARRNTLVVVQQSDHPLLLTRQVRVARVNWLVPCPPDPLVLDARIRHRQPLESARVAPLGHDEAQVEFARPQRAATPGQYAVFYDGTRCLGGGVIDATL